MGFGVAFLGFLELLLQLRHVLATLVGELAEVFGVLLLFFQLRFEPGDLLLGGGEIVRGRLGRDSDLGLRGFELAILLAQLLEIAVRFLQRLAQARDLSAVRHDRGFGALEIAMHQTELLLAIDEPFAELMQLLRALLELLLALGDDALEALDVRLRLHRVDSRVRPAPLRCAPARPRGRDALLCRRQGRARRIELAARGGRGLPILLDAAAQLLRARATTR